MRIQGIGLCIALGTLAACATEPGTPASTGTPFTQALAREYDALAAFEADEMYDWRDADHFQAKATMAGQGRNVLPDEVADRDVPEAAVGELNAARTRLMAALDAGSRDRMPNESAQAQARFDCWIEQQEENFQYDHISACRDDLMALIATLEAQPVAAAPEPEPATAAVAQGPYLVFFDWDKSDITPEAWATLRQAAEAAQAGGVSTIQVTGHADRSGTDQYNVGLSERRAEAVAGALASLGLDRDEMRLEWKGESVPLVQTADGVREPQNRRVEIVYP